MNATAYPEFESESDLDFDTPADDDGTRGIIMGKRDLCAYLGISIWTLDNQYLPEGLPVVRRGAKGVTWQINSADAFQWIMARHLRTARARDPEDANLTVAKTRKLLALAERTEAINRHYEETVILKTDADRASAECRAELRNHFMEFLPTHVVKQFEGLSGADRTPQACGILLEDCISDAIVELQRCA